MGKRIIALLLAFILCLSFSLVSFGATPTQGVSVSNWPQWFTGAHDASIASDLMFVRAHCANIAGYLELIEPDINDINGNVALIPGAISVTNGLIGDFKTLFNSFYTAFENIILNNYDDYHRETIGAIGGVTSAVHGTTSAVNSFANDFQYASDINNKNSLGYSLYMLQQVLADENDLANKKKAETVTNSSLISVTDSNNFINLQGLPDHLTVANDFLSMADFNFHVSDMQYVFDTNEFDLWAWFSQSTRDNIYGVVSPAVYSFRSAVGVPDVVNPDIVTDYYNDNVNQVKSFFGWGDDK